MSLSVYLHLSQLPIRYYQCRAIIRVSQVASFVLAVAVIIYVNASVSSMGWISVVSRLLCLHLLITYMVSLLASYA